MEPSTFTTAVPLPGARVTTTEAGTSAPSLSRSFSSTCTFTATSSSVVAASSDASGGSFDAATSMIARAFAHAPLPSHTS